ncbi:hypothetical protein ANAPRD1_00527 [Anaplasma phagocytophilum]|nr:hypothetical protein ANAPRD1_00527 [Anaplasma phagocytophilum]SCV64430.1 hypothetical protein ANAPH1_00596 [Anaplasma phagocytophilum]
MPALSHLFSSLLILFSGETIAACSSLTILKAGLLPFCVWNICCNSAGPGGLGCKSKLFTISRFAPKVFFVVG